MEVCWPCPEKCLLQGTVRAQFHLRNCQPAPLSLSERPSFIGLLECFLLDLKWIKLNFISLLLLRRCCCCCTTFYLLSFSLWLKCAVDLFLQRSLCLLAYLHQWLAWSHRIPTVFTWDGPTWSAAVFQLFHNGSDEGHKPKRVPQWSCCWRFWPHLERR